MDDKEIFDLVRESYANANADYISEQIRIASGYMSKDTAASATESDTKADLVNLEVGKDMVG